MNRKGFVHMPLIAIILVTTFILISFYVTSKQNSPITTANNTPENTNTPPSKMTYYILHHQNMDQ